MTTKINSMRKYRSGYDVQRFSYLKARHSLSSFSPGSFSVTVCKVKDIDWNKRKPVRGGIIVYTRQKGKLLFCLAVDRKTGDLTDFGGGISYKKDKSALGGALREFSEESLGVFGKFNEGDLSECVAALSDLMIIVFLPLDCDPEAVTEIFIKRQRKEKIVEVSALAWMELYTLCDSLYRKKKFYNRVAKLLQPTLLRILGNL